jgi:hypothetical protein
VDAFVLKYRAPTKWIQCTKYHKWAHDHCIGFSGFFNCNSVDRNGDFESEY